MNLDNLCGLQSALELYLLVRQGGQACRMGGGALRSKLVKLVLRQAEECATRPIRPTCRTKPSPIGRSSRRNGRVAPPDGWEVALQGGRQQAPELDRVPVSHGSAGNLWHFPPSLPPSLSSHRKAGFLPVIVRAKVVGAVFSVCGHPHATRPLSPN